MTPELITEIYREALLVTLALGAPILGVTLAVGLAVSIVQAATQINEMTLSFIPKAGATVLAIWLTGGWLLERWADYTRDLFALIERVPQLF